MKYLLMLLLIATPVFAGGLYEETKLTGECNNFPRMTAATISNPYNGVPSMEMATARQYYGTACPTTEVFERRGTISYLDFIGKRFPIYDADLNQVGYADGNTLWSIMTGAWVLERNKTKGQVGTLISDSTGATICYTTNKADQLCKLP